MNKTQQTQQVLDAIFDLVDKLTESEKVYLMTELYYSLDDLHKDKFLEETENA